MLTPTITETRRFSAHGSHVTPIRAGAATSPVATQDARGALGRD